jgi:ribosomal protein L20A (L18A)
MNSEGVLAEWKAATKALDEARAEADAIVQRYLEAMSRYRVKQTAEALEEVKVVQRAGEAMAARMRELLAREEKAREAVPPVGEGAHD